MTVRRCDPQDKEPGKPFCLYAKSTGKLLGRHATEQSAFKQEAAIEARERGDSVSVIRYDAGSLASPVKLDNGYLRCDGRLTRVGVFPYRQSDGTVRRELRLPQEVFDVESMASFGLVPLTNSHPTEMLDSNNTRRYQVGSVVSPRADEQFIAASVQVTDADSIAEIEKGKRDLSCGYKCDLEIRPGVTSSIPGIKDGLKYDAIQTNIRGNHVAIVTKGRAGSEASLRLDAEDAVLVTDDLPTGAESAPPNKGKVNKMKLDGVDYEMSEQAEQAVTQTLEKRDQQVVTLTAKSDSVTEELSKEKARADKLDEEKVELQKKFDEATDPATVQKRVDSRVDLITKAKSMIAEEDHKKLDTMTETEIKRVVVESRLPEDFDKAKLDDENYLNTRFDIECEKFDGKQKSDSSPGKRALAVVRAATAHSDSDNGGGTRSHMDARQEMIKRNSELPKLGRQKESVTA